MDQATTFHDISYMNVAFGNKKGDPDAINGKKLMMGVQQAIVELTSELDKAKEKNDVEGICDSICDAIVYLGGSYHQTGFDIDLDLKAIFESNMSKFCKDEVVLAASMEKYDKLGVQFVTEGSFPTVCLKSSTDQWLNKTTGAVSAYNPIGHPQGSGNPGYASEWVLEYPKGKFLKGAAYKKPILQARLHEEAKKVKAPTAAEVISQFDAIVEMQKERQARQAETKRKLAQLNEEVAAFRAKREQEMFGVPPFDGDANQMPGTVDESTLREIHEGTHTSGFIQTVGTARDALTERNRNS